MIKVLIVDDEKLARKGLIMTVPWSKFGLKVIGEAKNGEEAIEFIENNEVDLVLVDLLMPVMSGFELMKHIRENFPKIRVVVLTCHQEFGYIQESLRYGAIDYIVKTQLDIENIDDTIARIVKQIQYKSSYSSVLIISTDKDRNVKDIYDIDLIDQNKLKKLDAGIWFLPSNGILTNIEKLENIFLYSTEWIIVKTEGIQKADSDVIVRMLLDYIGQDLFYLYKFDKTIYDTSINEIKKLNPVTKDNNYQQLRNRITSLLWIFDDEIFKELIFWIEEVRPDKNIIRDLLCLTLSEWKNVLKINQLDEFFDWLNRLVFWEQWVKWMDKTRCYIRENISKTIHYSNDIVMSIIKAVDIINHTQECSLNENRIASEICISRGYFSECFKNIIGKSFSEYIKDVKMDKARTLLIDKRKPIYWIAEELGFRDVKYFSRTFKKHVGITPIEYRNKYEYRIK